RTAPAIALEVVSGSVLQRRRQAPLDPLDPFGGEDPMESMMRRRRAGASGEPKVFLEAALSRPRVHVGEPVLLTYYVYTQVSIRDGHLPEPPKYSGVWAEELPQPKQPPAGESVTVGGEPYHRVVVFGQKLLYPTRAGTLTLPPVTAQLVVPTGGFPF